MVEAPALSSVSRRGQEVKQALTDVIAEQELSQGAAYQGRPYVPRLKAEAAEASLEEAKRKLAALQLSSGAPFLSDTLQATAPKNGGPGPSTSGPSTSVTAAAATMASEG